MNWGRTLKKALLLISRIGTCTNATWTRTFTDTVLNPNAIKGSNLLTKAEFDKIPIDIEALAETQDKIESRQSFTTHGDFKLSAAYLINSIADEHHFHVLVSDTSTPALLRDDGRKSVSVYQTTFHIATVVLDMLPLPLRVPGRFTRLPTTIHLRLL
jgi:hypothetical protein